MQEIPTYTESELIDQLKNHDESAYRHLYDNYSKALFTIIYQIIPDQQQAEDILQQVFIKIWKNIDQYNVGKGRLFTWMLNIARNQSIDSVRSKEFNNRSKTIQLSENVYEREVTKSDVRDAGLNKVLEHLPADSRKLLELSYFQGFTQEEIAKILSIPLGTVKTRLRAIILQLRKKMITK